MSEISDAIDRLGRYDQHYVAYSDRLSLACRQLAFAEGAVFWAFKEPNNLSIWTAIGFIMIVCFFTADSLQYYFGMRDYEKLAEKTRDTLHKSEIDYKKINNKSVNERLENCLKWKLRFIAVASLWLIIVFVKKFILCG